MRTLALYLLLLTLYGTLAANDQCSPNSFVIQDEDEEHSHCDESIVLTKEGLPEFPAGGTKQLTFVVSIAQNTECEGVSKLPILGITVKPGGDASPEHQILEFRSPQGPDLTNSMDVYTTDKSGTPQLVSSEPFDLDNWNRIVVSIDLERNFVATQFLSEEGITSKLVTNLDFGDLVFDTTTTVYLGQSNADSNPAAVMLWKSFAFDYAYYPETELYRFLFQGMDIDERGLYVAQREGISQVTDTSEVSSAESFGPLYLGQAAAGEQDPNNVPASSQLGIHFTEASQFVTFKTPLPSISSEGHFYLLPVSFTVSFWIKLAEHPSDVQYILRRSTKDGSDVFALKIKPDGKIVAVISGTEITTTTQSLQVNQWTSVTAFFTVAVSHDSKEATVIIHFWDTLVTPEASLALTAIPTKFKETSTDSFRIGGFNGILNVLQFLSPGAPVVNSPSCSANTECKISLGYDYSQCLLTSCPPGTYYDGASCLTCDPNCRTCTGPGANACDSCDPSLTLQGTTCVGSTSAANVPTESTPTEPSTPTENTPTEVPPTENPPTETPPTENPPAENPPTETPPTEPSTPTENTPTENPPTETPPTENPPASTPPTETPPTENPPVVTPPTENPPTEPSPTTEKAPAGNTPTEFTASEKTPGEVPESTGTGPETDIRRDSKKGLSNGEVAGLVIASLIVVASLLYLLKRNVYIPYMTKLRSKEKYAGSEYATTGTPGNKQLPEPPTPMTPITPMSPMDNIPLTTQNRPPTPEKNLATKVLSG